MQKEGLITLPVFFLGFSFIYIRYISLLSCIGPHVSRTLANQVPPASFPLFFPPTSSSSPGKSHSQHTNTHEVHTPTTPPSPPTPSQTLPTSRSPPLPHSPTLRPLTHWIHPCGRGSSLAKLPGRWKISLCRCENHLFSFFFSFSLFLYFSRCLPSN